jgi:hypothetical protein
MDFSRLLLGYQEIEDLIKLAIKEKYITSYAKYAPEYYEPKSFKTFKQVDNSLISNTKINNKSRLLRMIMLYDNIDSNRLMPFDISRLIECGLFSENTISNKYSLADRDTEKLITKALLNMSESDDFRYRLFVRCLFIEIDKVYNISSLSAISDHEESELSKALGYGDIDKFNHLVINFEIKEIIMQELLDTYEGVLDDYKNIKNKLKKSQMKLCKNILFLLL